MATISRVALEQEPVIKMPLACISCIHYQPIGFDEDDHCPFKRAFVSSPAKTRTPYGSCSLHRNEVFATELCNSYSVEPFVKPEPTTNRPVPRCVRQERLSLEHPEGSLRYRQSRRSV